MTVDQEVAGSNPAVHPARRHRIEGPVPAFIRVEPVMISGPMFERFIVPELTGLCQWLDHAMYHLA